MGWFSDLLFGDQPAKTPGDTVLPKRVQAWEEGDSLPVPQPTTSMASEPTPPQQKASPYRTESGSKIIPNIGVEKIEPHLSGDMKHIEVWARIKNHSTFEIELRKINFLRQHTDVGRFLKPAEEHEVRIYTGDTPRSDAEHKAEVQFKIVDNDDYFQADFRIEYHYERDEQGEFYVPEEFHLIAPIRDI